MNKNELEKIVFPIEIDARKKIEEINAMSVLTRADFEIASEWLKAVVAVEKKLKNMEKERVSGYKLSIDSIKNSFKKPLELLADAQKIARDKLNAFLSAERVLLEKKSEQDFLSKQKQTKKELAKLARSDRTADKYDAITASAIRENNQEKRDAIIAATQRVEKINQSGEHSTVRMVWDFNIIDITKVPAEFLEIKASKVLAAIKSGRRDISGVEIFQKPVVAVK